MKGSMWKWPQSNVFNCISGARFPQESDNHLKNTLSFSSTHIFQTHILACEKQHQQWTASMIRAHKICKGAEVKMYFKKKRNIKNPVVLKLRIQKSQFIHKQNCLLWQWDDATRHKATVYPIMNDADRFPKWKS